MNIGNFWETTGKKSKIFNLGIIFYLILEMLGELNTPVGLSIWDKILLIKSKRVHALRDKI